MGGVTVRLVGAVGAVRSGPTQEVAIGSRKARRLLALLAVERARLVPTSQIVEVLWADRPPRQPVQGVATLVSRLRAVLGPDVVVGGRDGYRLTVRADLDDAADLVSECVRTEPADPAAACHAGRRALDILDGGPLLAGEPDTSWVHDARLAVEPLRRAARHATATAALSSGDAVLAREVAEAALGTDRLDEAAAGILIDACRAVGDRVAALGAYDRLRRDLADGLGVDPAPAVAARFAELLADAPAAPSTDLVGREPELVALRAAWSAAVSGRGGLMLVTGEGGIGKTRLAGELADAAQTAGAVVLRTRCYASERSLVLQPVVDALSGLPRDRVRELAGSRAGALADLLGLDGITDDQPGDRGEHLRRVFEGVVRVLRGLASRSPVLLLVDDVHNAGIATVELLHYLGRHVVGARVLVLVTLRTEEGRAVLDALGDVAARTELGPLDAAAVSRLAAAAGHAELAPLITRSTRGHTLFVVEALRGLVAGEAGVPGSLQAVVLARLARAGPRTEEVLRAGSVLGATVEPALVAALLELSPLVAAQRCAEAAEARLLVSTGRVYEFANDLVQEVLYATTPGPMRQLHHSRAADLLVGSPESVAVHAAAAGDLPRAGRSLLAAGERASRVSACADAEDLFGRAATTAREIDDRELLARALLARGRAREELFRYRAAMEDFTDAADIARLAGDRRLEMRALREYGGHCASAMGLPVALCTARLEAALAIAESLGAREDEADILGWLAVLATSRLRFTESVALGLRAVRAARAARSDHALAAGLDGLKNAYAYLGENEPLLDVIAELEPLVRRLDDRRLLPWAVFEASFPALAAGDWAHVEQVTRDAVALVRSTSHRLPESWFVAHLAWLARQQGHLDEAVAHGRAALVLAESAEHRWFVPATGAQLGLALLERGDRAEALDVLTTAYSAADPDGPEAYVLRPLAPLALVSGSRAHLETADRMLAAISAPPGTAWLLGADTYLAVARAWSAQSEPERARSVLRPLLAAARRTRWLPVLADAGLVDARASAALGDPAAPAALEEAVALAVRLGMPGVVRQAVAVRLP